MYTKTSSRSNNKNSNKLPNRLESIGENTKLASNCGRDFVEFDDDETEDVDLSERARIHRGMSKAYINANLVSNARTFMQADIQAFKDDHNFNEKTKYAFAIPNLENLNKSQKFGIDDIDFKALIYKELIDSSVLVTLEQNGDLNWWADNGICHRLYPYITNGDGNCLLHAASLAMWGFHDRNTLRKVLYEDLSASKFPGLKRRWRLQQTQSNQLIGLIMDEQEWDVEWKNIVQMASTERLKDDVAHIDDDSSSSIVYESLEEFHVFFLSHVLRRPIIIISLPFLLDTAGSPLAPIPFGGIYLPLERAPEECCKFPLLLTYNLSHFSALVPMEDGSSDSLDGIPLLKPDYELMEIHYSVDPGPKIDPRNYHKVPPLSSAKEKMKLIMKYMDVQTVEKLPRLEFFGKSSKPKDFSLTIKKLSTKLDEISLQSTGSLDRISKFGSPNHSAERTTQSTRNLSSPVAPRNIPCVKLSQKRTPFYHEFIQNYLDDAEMRFKQSRIQKTKQHDEMRRRSIDGKFIFNPTPTYNKFPNTQINSKSSLFVYNAADSKDYLLQNNSTYAR